jgi:hypothetical protein
VSAGDGRADLLLFGEGPSRVVVSVPSHAERHFEGLMGEFALPWRWIGRVGGESLVIARNSKVLVGASVDRMAHAWRVGFERHVA